ncbi:Bug family tripartite tricarboxylate transporter substrate binding protein [Plastoroseomonas hellenica]|uniref:Bug family tripartite tricarboxylate transporter substrate binding protein n=1 Tax=Plastoroseomonas hellenica TaxID=2687306 RepID=UPI001BA7EB1B|nr:tripartite tricarboxylate transporter substrate-binding protein [Plastoroseomonas hellenica]MBR0646853.1 tripartite tricarboxylate transporter substrate binding protein [Plastoroseomonas hellenica]
MKPTYCFGAPHRRDLLKATLSSAALGLVTGAASAQQMWPARPIRWILGFAPGGAGDITARLLAPRLHNLLGQPVLIENRPSAGGIVAAEAVARAEPDGHILLLVTSTSPTAAAFYRALPFDTERDFAPVGMISTFGHALLAAANAPWRNLAEVIAAAKARPGSVNLGSISVGTAQHFAAERFKLMAGIRAETITYRSTPDLLNAIATGDVHLGFETLPPVIGQIGPGGRVKALAISSEERFPALMDIPTVMEAGLPGYVAESWNGIQAPARTPGAVVQRLNRELNHLLALPDIRDRLLTLGLVPQPSDPRALQERLSRETAIYRRVMEEAGIAQQ